ncbi:MAG: hypothetical protein AAGJ28_15290 [Pseudomonadota bacterium]
MILLLALLASLIVWGLWVMAPRHQERRVRIRVDDRPRGPHRRPDEHPFD